jgi:hypothetical protein
MLPRRDFSLNDNISLPILKLKERIIAYLQNRYSKLGKNDAVSWRGIWIESGTTEEEFREALNAAAEAEIVFADSDHIRLRSSGRPMNKLVPANIAASNVTTSEQQLYARVVTLIRLLLQFGRKQPVSD